MTYGIQSFKNATTKNIDPSMLGGRVFVKYIQQTYVAGVTVDIPIPNVSSHTYLKFYTLMAGPYSVSSFTNGGLAYVRLTPYSRPQGFTFQFSTVILVFATQTVEPDYGILSTNSNGERLVSSIYPVPQFLEKLSFGNSLWTSNNYPTGRGTSEHISTNPVSLGNGRKKVALYTIPENTQDVWYFFDNTYVGTGLPYVRMYVEAPLGATYNLPEIYIFALDNASPSGDTYGLRLYGPSPSNELLFDSGHTYVDIKGFDNVFYGQLATSTTIADAGTTAYLIPNYQLEIAEQIPDTSATYYYQYKGGVKRMGNTLFSKRIFVSRAYEDAVNNYYYELGASSNTIFYIDIAPLGGSGSSGTGGTGSPLSATIQSTSGNTSCSYNPNTASICSTSETFSINTSGGDGTTISYIWSLENATGFSITGSNTAATVTVANNSTAGTYTGTLKCIVSQSGSVQQIPTYSLSHTHTAQSVPSGIVNPLTCQNTTTEDQNTNTSAVDLNIHPDGTWTITGNSSIAPLESGNWLSPTTAGVGASYSVFFTRTATNGIATETSTAWQSLSSTRSVGVFAQAVSADVLTYATYTIQIRDSNSVVVSTTSGVTLNAYAIYDSGGIPQ